MLLAAYLSMGLPVHMATAQEWTGLLIFAVLIALCMGGVFSLLAGRRPTSWTVLATMAWASAALLIRVFMLPLWDQLGSDSPGAVLSRAMVLSLIASLFMPFVLARRWISGSPAMIDGGG